LLWLFTAPIATHLGAELVERYGAEHREPLAEHLERHPDHSLAALAPDPGITFGSVLFSAGHFPVAFSPQSSARYAPSKVQFLSERKKSGSSRIRNENAASMLASIPKKGVHPKTAYSKQKDLS